LVGLPINWLTSCIPIINPSECTPMMFWLKISILSPGGAANQNRAKVGRQVPSGEGGDNRGAETTLPGEEEETGAHTSACTEDGDGGKR